jgi:copper chaperone CopZ
MEEVTLVVPSIGCQGCMKKIVKQLDTTPSRRATKQRLSSRSTAG